MDVEGMILRYAREGFACAQMLALTALSLEDRENPELIRAMSGLNSGLGRAGFACGALTGGAAAFGLFTGNGDPEELPHSRAREITAEYARWFEDRFGGRDCRDFLGGDFTKFQDVCLPMVTACAERLLEMIDTHRLLEG
jgi:C_GCAxxG_C_C family probable redox protein